MEFSQTEKIVTQFFIEREGEEILKVIKKKNLNMQKKNIKKF